MSLNKIILIGRTGKDPEIRYFDSNSAVANFSLATSERGYKLANGTEVPERTEWHNVVAYRELAIFAEKWIKKGSLLYVEGKIRYRTYVDNTGVRRQVTEILAEKINFFESGSSNRDESRTSQTSSSTQDTMPLASSSSVRDTAKEESSEPPSDLPF
ncbi:single-stranded DNA-binding protein [Porphyromonas gingivalis]|uniref:Single-stranded DNA-binding protein n=3 Tax=Porphyromonas gingivalis TaxID=837 RepID=B2RHP3_PORG3|nr:single-stranded DNA-binding protein [Porphyromonas gingivalis]EOA10812.1 single-stranded DNA-binding protein [Porphyromonas gingivalis JCVI SC001]AIJ35444.1 single-stranded DNA-binding protein [Porphyromonas gingivalis]ALJ24836.1 single stranded DNA-binding protein [Porphyromonas gingivalis 381]ATR90364.1 single-stranded DNA-binding protein [Porphyromonas gingivalis]ATR93148.1 single-stranded DNA-binding protein [Porphyromonas gingivalis]